MVEMVESVEFFIQDIESLCLGLNEKASGKQGNCNAEDIGEEGRVPIHEFAVAIAEQWQTLIDGGYLTKGSPISVRFPNALDGSNGSNAEFLWANRSFRFIPTAKQILFELIEEGGELLIGTLFGGNDPGLSPAKIAMKVMADFRDIWTSASVLSKKEMCLAYTGKDIQGQTKAGFTVNELIDAMPECGERCTSRHSLFFDCYFKEYEKCGIKRSGSDEIGGIVEALVEKGVFDYDGNSNTFSYKSIRTEVTNAASMKGGSDGRFQ